MNDAIVFYTSNTHAEVYYSFMNTKHNTPVYLVKLMINDIGVYINSITVQSSLKYPDKLWVQSPRYYVRGSWIWPVQMQRDSRFRKLLEKLALEAVAKYTGKDINGVKGFTIDGEFQEHKPKFL